MSFLNLSLEVGLLILVVMTVILLGVSLIMYTFQRLNLVETKEYLNKANEQIKTFRTEKMDHDRSLSGHQYHVVFPALQKLVLAVKKHMQGGGLPSDQAKAFLETLIAFSNSDRFLRSVQGEIARLGDLDIRNGNEDTKLTLDWARDLEQKTITFMVIWKGLNYHFSVRVSL